jgi:8-oxo-dGTP pyrophosphatase MutT (NUDIX family)
MVSFDDGDQRFQVRAAAIIRREGHVLIHRATRDHFWSLPGGRVEQHETSTETLRREMREELLVEARPGPLVFLVESFFSLGPLSVHELGLYHGVELPETFPFARHDVCHRIVDGDADLEFKWVPATEAALAASDFRPIALRGRLAEPPDGAVHLVDREGPR